MKICTVILRARITWNLVIFLKNCWFSIRCIEELSIRWRVLLEEKKSVCELNVKANANRTNLKHVTCSTNAVVLYLMYTCRRITFRNSEERIEGANQITDEAKKICNMFINLAAMPEFVSGFYWIFELFNA